ncbi:MAG: glycosyltransferase [Candidatus Binatia bacterium]
MLKILHVDPERAWGGGEAQVSSLTTHLLRSGHHSVVAADPLGVLSLRLREAGLPVVPLRIRNHLDLRAAFHLRWLVQRGQYDIVHFHTARAHALSPWLHGLKGKRLVTRRMDYPLRTGAMTRFLYLHCVDMVVAISQGVYAALTEGNVPPSRIRLIPSGVDTMRFAPDPLARERLRSRYSIDTRNPLVVSVGALVERKGHDFLLTAARFLKEKGYHLHYLICGKGPLHKTLVDQVQTLGIVQEVQLIGFCPNVPEFLAAADFFVHVPHYEGLGVAIIEALAAGLPIIASRVGGIPELIEEGKTGLLVPPQDAESLSRSLLHLLENPSFARQLGKAGQMFARKHLDARTMAQANEALYLELLADTA